MVPESRHQFSSGSSRLISKAHRAEAGGALKAARLLRPEEAPLRALQASGLQLAAKAVPVISH
jgi:hypothetical protein